MIGVGKTLGGGRRLCLKYSKNRRSPSIPSLTCQLLSNIFFLLDGSAEKLKRNDGLSVRRAIMLSPIMPGEQEIAQEEDALIAAVSKSIVCPKARAS